MEIVDLNLIPGEAFPVCHTSQFDAGRTIRFKLYDGSNVYTLSGTETLTLKVKKPDTTIVTTNLTNTSDDYVDIITTRQMCACPGKNVCEINIANGSVSIGTLNFYMEVEEDPLNNGVTSQSAIHDLETQVEDIIEELIGGGLTAINMTVHSSEYTIRED